jgi:hypothetical protein
MKLQILSRDKIKTTGRMKQEVIKSHGRDIKHVW